MIRLLQSWKDSPDVPADWRASTLSGAVVKVRVHNRAVAAALKSLLPGVWRKVYRKGVDGSEVHYFEHASGTVALVKHKRK